MAHHRFRATDISRQTGGELFAICVNSGCMCEIEVRDKTYLCHLAELSEPRTEGWVVVLNDVTQLKELDRLKSQMVQMTSHDLKNPLQAAMSYIELLQDDGRDTFTPTWDITSRTSGPSSRECTESSVDSGPRTGAVWNAVNRKLRGR